ncbi:hypothetical protein SKAU_G00358260 [Synaphobranchus kaupii]|uniref:Uncharacterized protein n=1 Tax=Synaphobranchus kaupii TaxID=118154 RepID=A0A9Q1EHV0_SYNKA|nr:hypothetical protein SKAU_G00358260 [Synaphobranchus kaupii]
MTSYSARSNTPLLCADVLGGGGVSVCAPERIPPATQESCPSLHPDTYLSSVTPLSAPQSSGRTSTRKLNIHRGGQWNLRGHSEARERGCPHRLIRIQAVPSQEG